MNINHYKGIADFIDEKYREKFVSGLEQIGDLYTFDDIMKNIAEHKMQSFVTGNTWAITEVHDFPRRRVLNILLVVGDLEDTQDLHDRIVKFASEINASLITAYGRQGWNKFTVANGWHSPGMIYHKEM